METTPSPSPKTRRLVGLALAFVVILTLAVAGILALRNDNDGSVTGNGEECDQLFADWLDAPSGSNLEADIEQEARDTGCVDQDAFTDEDPADYEAPTASEIDAASDDELRDMFWDVPAGSDAEVDINEELEERGETIIEGE